MHGILALRFYQVVKILRGGEVGFKRRIRMWGLDTGQTNPVFGKVQAINFS